MTLHRHAALAFALGLLLSQALPCIPGQALSTPQASADGSDSVPIMIAACLCGCKHVPSSASPISHELVVPEAELKPADFSPVQASFTVPAMPNILRGDREPPSPPPRHFS